KCVKSLIANGADILAENHIPQRAIAVANNLEIVTTLVSAGADINDINGHARADLLGYRVNETPDISRAEYLKDKTRVFGKYNPERANIRSWLAFVQCAGSD